MPPIFVNTDNSSSSKIYDAKKTGSIAGGAETKMQAIVKKTVDGAADFTTNKVANAKGYTLSLTVSEVSVKDGKTTCKMTGAISKFPPGAGKGEDLVTSGMSSKATADGTGDGAVMDCIEAITEDVARKSLAVMRTDFNKQ